MKQTETIKKYIDFKNVYDFGKSYANKYLVMYVVKNDTDKNNLGISVSKKVGNSVVRHRVKRLIKESYRLNETSIQTGLDIVIVARVGAKDKNYSEISSALMHLAKLQNICVKRDDKV